MQQLDKKLNCIDSPTPDHQPINIKTSSHLSSETLESLRNSPRLLDVGVTVVFNYPGRYFNKKYLAFLDTFFSRYPKHAKPDYIDCLCSKYVVKPLVKLRPNYPINYFPELNIKDYIENHFYHEKTDVFVLVQEPIQSPFFDVMHLAYLAYVYNEIFIPLNYFGNFERWFNFTANPLGHFLKRRPKGTFITFRTMARRCAGGLGYSVWPASRFGLKPDTSFKKKILYLVFAVPASKLSEIEHIRFKDIRPRDPKDYYIIKDLSKTWISLENLFIKPKRLLKREYDDTLGKI